MGGRGDGETCLQVGGEEKREGGRERGKCSPSPHTFNELGGGDREGAPIHMPMIRLETVENHLLYCLMPSNNFIVKKSGTQAGIESTTFGVLTHCSNH